MTGRANLRLVSLYRTWRPRTFAELVGQDAVVKTLTTALETGRLAHAYLFSGPRGSGKTSAAKILARCIECVNGPTATPDNTCENCVAILEGTALDVLEIDAASNRGIDEIRALRDAVKFAPSSMRKKVYIIDEAHMLTKEGANAFLKTLEEPPNNSLLLLLSAIPEVLPDTIRSRCLAIPLAPPTDAKLSDEANELLELLNGHATTGSGEVHEAYQLVQGFQRLLGRIRRSIEEENDEAQQREETRYRNTTDGAWLEHREEHYKAFTESLYLHRRAELVEILFRWWGDVLRSGTGVPARELPTARASTEASARRLTTQEILQRLRRLEELRDHLGRNIPEALALEVAFLNIFRF